jgi:hypothetical protein
MRVGPRLGLDKVLSTPQENGLIVKMKVASYPSAVIIEGPFTFVEYTTGKGPQAPRVVHSVSRLPNPLSVSMDCASCPVPHQPQLLTTDPLPLAASSSYRQTNNCSSYKESVKASKKVGRVSDRSDQSDHTTPPHQNMHGRTPNTHYTGELTTAAASAAAALKSSSSSCAVGTFVFCVWESKTGENLLQHRTLPTARKKNFSVISG